MALLRDSIGQVRQEPEADEEHELQAAPQLALGSGSVPCGDELEVSVDDSIGGDGRAYALGKADSPASSPHAGCADSLVCRCFTSRFSGMGFGL